MKILLKVSGSISAYKVCGVVSSLVKMGHEVKVASSASALHFVGAAAWEGLSGKPVLEDDFSPGQRMQHIHLNDWADVVVLAPASAQTLNAIAKGVGSGVLTTLFLARNQEKPYLIFPAMNPRMWESPSVQESVENLKSQENIAVLSPDKGLVACGHDGVGRLREPDEILNEILKYDHKSKRALVTFGGTTEDIDGVRQITNFSSGKTGLEICKKLRKKFKVTALGSEQALKGVQNLEGVELKSFFSSEELAETLKAQLSDKSFDLVVHAAAVSDFLPKTKMDKKISSAEEFKIEFKKAPKILNQIKIWSKNKSLKLVSFKLTHNQSSEEILSKIEKQFASSETDFIVHNEFGEISRDHHNYTIWGQEKRAPISVGTTKNSMAEDIIKLFGFDGRL